MNKDITVDEFDEATDLLYSFVQTFPDGDSEPFSMQVIELTNLAHMKGWNDAIQMVIDVCRSMYTDYDEDTLQELEQRIV